MRADAEHLENQNGYLERCLADARNRNAKLSEAIRRYLKAERALRDAQSSPEWQKKFPGLDAMESPELQEKIAALDAMRQLV